ncbi:MAG TPA: maleylacetate reductase [Vicinamibacterales bacterium]|nr:maleylacetate reductase [Vicinamibacterales bacterium]
MRAFVFDQPAYRVVFGAGSIDQLKAEVERLGAHRALVVSTPAERALADDAARRLGEATAGLFTEAVMHHPIETVRAARAAAHDLGADCCVTIGGGTTTGTGKVIALEAGLPIVAIPTTYAGSEMTPIYGITEGGVKKTGRDRRVLPRAVIYDPQLTLSLPPGVSATSGMNAMAHCVEGLYAFDGNPIVTLMAAEGIRALARALPAIVREPSNLDARADALYGAWLAGIVLGTASIGIHHKLCHTLGGTFNLPHAEVHTVILPHATAYNRDAAPEAMRLAAEALGAADAAQGIFDLVRRLGAPTSLRQIGMPADGLDRAAELATQNQYPNPRPVEYAGVRELLQHAYDGRRPV